jgi:hypothetical protein
VERDFVAPGLAATVARRQAFSAVLQANMSWLAREGKKVGGGGCAQAGGQALHALHCSTPGGDSGRDSGTRCDILVHSVCGNNIRRHLQVGMALRSMPMSSQDHGIQLTCRRGVLAFSQRPRVQVKSEALRMCSVRS